MKKRRNWVSSLKCCCISTDKRQNIVSDNDGKKEKKGFGQRKSKSFIPLFREPSSIEKIFSDFEKGRENIEFRPPILVEEGPPVILPSRDPSQIVKSPITSSPVVASPENDTPNVSPPRIIRHQHEEINHVPELTCVDYHASATKIQAVFRGHLARRGFRALKGLVRLQGVVSGNNVKRQTSNAMKQMQRLVRVQSQIHTWRVRMMENQCQNNDQYKNDKEVESNFSRSRQTSEAGYCKNWDDSFITKNERDARMRRKMEAIINRERALSFAYSPELLKNTPKSAQETPTRHPSPRGDLRWCNWLERQLPLQTLNQSSISPRKSETWTPKSTKSTATKPEQTPPSLRSSPAKSISNMSRFSRKTPRGGRSLFDAPLNDNDSLMSCPPFLGPRYMAPTISFKAKERATLYSRERYLGTPNSQTNRRLSYPTTNESKFSKAFNPRNLDENRSVHSIESPVIASPASLPPGVGRRPFNRFV